MPLMKFKVFSIGLKYLNPQTYLIFMLILINFQLKWLILYIFFFF